MAKGIRLLLIMYIHMALTLAKFVVVHYHPLLGGHSYIYLHLASLIEEVEKWENKLINNLIEIHIEIHIIHNFSYLIF